jgi:DNA invertase Pin-like site-specific DNA recombinase
LVLGPIRPRRNCADVDGFEAARRYGVRYRSYQEAFIDTTSAFGDLLAAFVAKIAELERKRIVERIHAGLSRARAEGKKLGRKRIVFDRQKVYDLRDQGQSISAICGNLGLSRGTVQRALDTRSQ